MFSKIRNNNLYQILFPLMALIYSQFLVTTANAHEMWIQPLNYSVKVGDKIFANETVGENFKGNKYAYLDSSYHELNITVGDKTRAVSSRLGDLPTIQEKASVEGLHIITAETLPSSLTYETPEKFLKFLKLDGLDWVLEAHKKRGLPEKGFKELYIRTPKTLVKVGDGKGQDRALGLPFEWIAETNPYTTKGNIRAQLLWQGKPAANMYVNVFNKPKRNSKNSELVLTHLRTDANGRIEIPRAKGGLFLINSVKMIQSDAETEKTTGAVWASIWGSLTYEILLKI